MTERPPITIHVAATRCPYCHANVRARDRHAIVCASCLARHHGDCWDRCGSCGDVDALARVEPKQQAPSPHESTKEALWLGTRLTAGAVGFMLAIVFIIRLFVAARADEVARYLEFLSTTGWIGVTSMLFVLAVTARACYRIRTLRRKRSEALTRDERDEKADFSQWLSAQARSHPELAGECHALSAEFGDAPEPPPQDTCAPEPKLKPPVSVRI